MPIVRRADPSDKNAGVDIHALMLAETEERVAPYKSAAFESFVIPPPQKEK